MVQTTEQNDLNPSHIANPDNGAGLLLSMQKRRRRLHVESHWPRSWTRAWPMCDLAVLCNN